MKISRSTATLLYMVFVIIILMIPSMCSAQTSSTVTSQSYSVKDLASLTVELNNIDTVHTVKENSSRVIVERRITVRHNTHSDAVLHFVKNQGAFNENAFTDKNLDTLILSEKPTKKEFIANGTNADIHVEYTLYVPEHIKIFQ